MENFIILAIIIISVLINAISNYKKESKKNSKRVIKKSPHTVNPPVETYDQTERSPYNSLETIDSLEYHTINNNYQASKTSDYISKYNTQFDEINEASADESHTSSINSVFKTEDELRKAVLYSIILERKF